MLSVFMALQVAATTHHAPTTGDESDRQLGTTIEGALRSLRMDGDTPLEDETSTLMETHVVDSTDNTVATRDEVPPRLIRYALSRLETIKEGLQNLLDVLVWNANTFAVNRPYGGKPPIPEVDLPDDIDEIASVSYATLDKVGELWAENIRKASATEAESYMASASTASMMYWVHNSLDIAMEECSLWSGEDSLIIKTIVAEVSTMREYFEQASRPVEKLAHAYSEALMALKTWAATVDLIIARIN